MNTLKAYIEAHGDDSCAARWGVTPRAVASWRRGERVPDIKTAKLIIAETGGALTWDMIYGAPEALPGKKPRPDQPSAEAPNVAAVSG